MEKDTKCSAPKCPLLREYGRIYCAGHTSRVRRGLPIDTPVRPYGMNTMCPCGKPAKARGLCNAHYGRIHRYGWEPKVAFETPVVEYNRNRSPVCTIKECVRPHAAKGMCQRHYTQAHTYNLTLEELQLILEESGGVCGICGSSEYELLIDHCHQTQEVRGMLCSGCNSGLGLLGDTQQSLERAMEYLKQSLQP